MKIKYKFFILFIFNALLILFLMAVSLYFIHYKNHLENIDNMELDSLNSFVNALKNTYKDNNGWEKLKHNPQKWVEIVVTNLEKDRRTRHNIKAPLNQTKNEKWAEDQRLYKQKFDESVIQILGFDSEIPCKVKKLPIDPMQLGLRLFLMDHNKKIVAGNTGIHTGYLRKLILENKIIGYIGLAHPMQKIHHPLVIKYMATKIQLFYVIGVGILIISVMLSYYISRKILKPIDNLIKGTEDVKSLKLDSHIDVESRDELGILSENFNHMIETLNRYEKIRKKLMTDISHELKTPLANIRCTIEAMIDGIYNINKSTVSSVNSELVLLGKLIDDIHMLALADSNNLPVKKEWIYPIDTLAETLDLFQSEISKQQLTIQSNLDAMESATLYGDELYFVRLFSNLISNTLKYTDSGGVLKISTTCQNNALVICFDDSMPGVPDEALNRLFDRLFRVDKSRSRNLTSSGLGLSICKEIVNIHNGTIQANHSKLGGLQIVITLPIQGS